MKLREALGVIAAHCVRTHRSEVRIRVADRAALEKAAAELDLSITTELMGSKLAYDEATFAIAGLSVSVVGPVRKATPTELLVESARLSAAALTPEVADAL